MKSRALAAVVLLFISVAATAQMTTANRGSEVVRKAADDYWSFLERESYAIRMREGLPIDRLPDVSLAHAESNAAFGRSLLDRLDAAREANLSHEDFLTAAILRDEAKDLAEAPSRYWLTFPVTPYIYRSVGGHPIFSSFVFQSKADADRYLMLLRQYPALVNELETKLREQEKRGILLAKDEIPLVLGSFDLPAAEKEKNLFWVKTDRLSRLSAADSQAFTAALSDVIETQVRGAVASLVKYLSSDYRDRAPAAVGLGQYPGGKEYYRALVRRTTMAAATPEAIHKAGLEGIEKLNAELDAVRKRVGFSGTLGEFRTFLKTDPRFFAKTPDEVGQRLMAEQNRILPRIPEFFGRTPKAPFGVERLEPQLEGAVTFGYYQTPTAAEPKGYYKYNGSNLPQRSLLFAGALISHELVPGHHFQINLQHENETLPRFRREGFYTAFGEGWGDYASDLAGQMGLYEDPYDRAGRIAMDLFLTSRLVVDTGMNFFGWPRDRAIGYMKENTLQSDTEIDTETLRYSCDMPAQALAYKMGMRKLVELREKARRQLGAKFDIRKFHDAVLGSGSMPLDILEKHVDWFIQQEKK